MSEDIQSVSPLIQSTVTYALTRFFTGLELALMHRCEYRETGHIPREGGALIVCNHQSFLDIPIVANSTPERRHVCFVARDTLADFRPMGVFMGQCRAILIKRGSAERGALNEMIERLKAGGLVCVFPEGTRSLDGSLGEFLPGAVFAAKRARVPLIPAGIRGAFLALPKLSKLPIPRFRRISICFGEAIDSKERDALEQARSVIQGLVGDGRYEP